VNGPAKVGDVMAPGVVFVPFHYGELGAETSANDLMPKTWDPASKQPIQKFACVRLERGDGPRDRWWDDDAAPIGAMREDDQGGAR